MSNRRGGVLGTHARHAAREARTAPTSRNTQALVSADSDEDRGRALVAGRSRGLCEGCGEPRPLDKAHRVARSRGGTWSPANILDLCRDCHTWAHAHPVDAIAVGWHVPTTADPATAPAYAWKRGGPMWILFDHDGDWTAVAAPADLSESGGTPSPLPLYDSQQAATLTSVPVQDGTTTRKANVYG